MLFNLSIFKIQGDSMSPNISDDSFIITKPFSNIRNKNKLLIFKHKVYGKLVKRLNNIDSSNFFWFKGDSYTSISMDDIGPIKREQIIGEIILCCVKVYEKISEKLSSSSIRTTTVVPTTTVTPISNIKYIEPLNCIIIENPNTNECNKYAIGVPIKN